MQRLVHAFWPVVAWMGVIFLLSSDAGSAANTGRFLVPMLHWLNPEITPEAVTQVQWIIRKGAHLTEYALLAILTVRALRILRIDEAGIWSWRVAALAIALCTTFAATDELHQRFIATRTSSPYDVLIDAVGALIGVALAYGWIAFHRVGEAKRFADICAPR